MLSIMNALLLFIFIIFASINSSLCIPYTCNTSLSCGCSSVSTINAVRIVGGEAAANHAWSWMVSFQLDSVHRCGASLLTAEYAVTAAHCVYGLLNRISEFSILAGTNYLDDTTSSTIQRRTITRIGIHPNYNTNTVTNDIAIIQFSPLTITNTSELGFICLPDPYEDPFQTGDNLITIGWGVTNEQNNNIADLSNYLQQVTVQAFSSTLANCVNSGLANSTVQFCAGVVGGGKDACFGDSGGPLMAFYDDSWVLAGIVSAGIGCAEAAHPGIYTRVSSFISFIEANLDGSFAATAAPPTTTTISTKPNNGCVIIKSISILIFSFLFLIFH